MRYVFAAGFGIGFVSEWLVEGSGVVVGGLAAVGLLLNLSPPRPGRKQRAAYMNELRALEAERHGGRGERTRLRVIHVHADVAWIVRGPDGTAVGVLLGGAPERFVWLSSSALQRDPTHEIKAKWVIELLPKTEKVLTLRSWGPTRVLRAAGVRADESARTIDAWPLCEVLDLADLPPELAQAVRGDADAYRR
jgi:hypothetical protein